MRMYDIIMKKRNGGELTEEEIHFFVEGYTKGEIPDYQVSALMMAAKSNTPDVVEGLLEHGACINAKDSEGRTALMYAAAFNRDFRVLKALLDSGVELDSLRNAIQRDSINFAYVRKGYFQRGDNQYVDQTEWKVGVRNEIPSSVDQTTVIVCIRELRDPEPKTLKEARGLVTSDYQVELEQKWVQSLKDKYPVKINEKVLEKVRKMYK